MRQPSNSLFTTLANRADLGLDPGVHTRTGQQRSETAGMPALAPTLISAPALLAEAVVPLESPSGPWAPLLDWVGQARVVLIGDASGGSHELFRARAEITRRLIVERGFTTVALVGRARGRAFPAWQWHNPEMLDFAGWLRAFNETRPREVRARLHELAPHDRPALLESVASFLRENALSEWAAFRNACAGAGTPCGGFPEAPGPLLPARVEAELLAHLHEHHPGVDEAILRALVREPHLGWERHSCHLASSLDALLADGERKVVVWAHAAHVADTRAFDAADTTSLGQHMRERHASSAFLIGLTTSHGTRTAAPAWGAPPGHHRLPPALAGSVEALFHATGVSRFLLNLQDDEEATEALREPRALRLPGPVALLPECELKLAEAFDAVAHFDQTRALAIL